MSANKLTVERYIDGFNRSDHAQILSCLSDEVEWVMPGAFHVTGKEAFDREIENDAFTGRPTVRITRMVEENNVVMAEVPCARRGKAAVFSKRSSAMRLKWREARSSAWSRTWSC